MGVIRGMFRWNSFFMSHLGSFEPSKGPFTQASGNGISRGRKNRTYSFLWGHLHLERTGRAVERQTARFRNQSDFSKIPLWDCEY